jgi:hypothetical protein
MPILSTGTSGSRAAQSQSQSQLQSQQQSQQSQQAQQQSKLQQSIRQKAEQINLANLTQQQQRDLIEMVQKERLVRLKEDLLGRRFKMANRKSHHGNGNGNGSGNDGNWSGSGGGAMAVVELLTRSSSSRPSP